MEETEILEVQITKFKCKADDAYLIRVAKPISGRCDNILENLIVSAGAVQTTSIRIVYDVSRCAEV
jgi:spore maturation protein SpmB